MMIDLLRSQLCRSCNEVLNTQESRKTAMLDRGWQEP
jgi:hypothetical protein